MVKPEGTNLGGVWLPERNVILGKAAGRMFCKALVDDTNALRKGCWTQSTPIGDIAWMLRNKLVRRLGKVNGIELALKTHITDIGTALLAPRSMYTSKGPSSWRYLLEY